MANQEINDENFKEWQVLLEARHNTSSNMFKQLITNILIA